MKDFILKEFFWLIVFSIVALLLAFFYLSTLKLTYSEPFMNDIEKVFTFQLYFIGWLVSLISLYIIRVTVSVIKKIIG